jgi:hypothetical protein
MTQCLRLELPIINTGVFLLLHLSSFLFFKQQMQDKRTSFRFSWIQSLFQTCQQFAKDETLGERQCAVEG